VLLSSSEGKTTKLSSSSNLSSNSQYFVLFPWEKEQKSDLVGHSFHWTFYSLIKKYQFLNNINTFVQLVESAMMVKDYCIQQKQVL